MRRIPGPFFIPLLLALAALLAASHAAAADGTEPSFRDRLQAVDRLYDAGGERAAREIIPYLRDRELGVRSHAMRRLVDLGTAAVEPLIAILADEEVRWLASGALINIGPEAIRPAVLALKDRNPIVRRNILFILRQLDARAAAPSIQEALSDPDVSVQIQAIQTIAQFGGEGGQRLVMSKIESKLPAIRDAAIEALPKFGPDALPSLSSLLSYGDPDVRVAVMRALGSMSAPEARALIVRMGLQDTAPSVRYYACVVLGESGDPSILADIAKLFDDPDPAVREGASDAFSRMCEPGRPLLFRYLREGNQLQKISAATTFRKARHRPAVPILVEAMRDRSRDVKVSAVAALMVLGDPGSVEPLVQGLGDEEIRWICIMALRQFGETNLRPLLRRTNDPQLDYWKQYVLEGMGEKLLDGCLETLKKEEDIGTRIATLCTMKQIKDTRAVYPIIRLLGDDKLGYVASFALSQMGDVAVEPLLLTLQDDNPEIRARAALALGDIGFTRVVRPLKDLLADRDPKVRRAASQAIRKLSGQDASPASGILSEPCLE